MTVPTHDLFRVHFLNQAGLSAAQELATEFSRLGNWIEQRIPPGRERSLTMTHLQDAAFHAKRALADLPELQAGVVASAGDFKLGPSAPPPWDGPHAADGAPLAKPLMPDAADGTPLAKPVPPDSPNATLPGSVFNTNKETK